MKQTNTKSDGRNCICINHCCNVNYSRVYSAPSLVCLATLVAPSGIALIGIRGVGSKYSWRRIEVVAFVLVSLLVGPINGNGDNLGIFLAKYLPW